LILPWIIHWLILRSETIWRTRA